MLGYCVFYREDTGIDLRGFSAVVVELYRQQRSIDCYCSSLLKCRIQIVYFNSLRSIRIFECSNLWNYIVAERCVYHSIFMRAERHPPGQQYSTFVKITVMHELAYHLATRPCLQAKASQNFPNAYPNALLRPRSDISDAISSTHTIASTDLLVNRMTTHTKIQRP